MTLDERIFTTINQAWTSPVLDWWGALVRASDVWLLPGLLMAGLVLWKGSRKAKGVLVLCLVVFVVGDGLVVRTSKVLIGRPRPDEVVVTRSVRLAPARPRVLGILRPLDVRTRAPEPSLRGYRSFPSGHAWNAFAVATVLALCFRRRGWLAYVPAAAIAYSRIYTGQHWPSDVVVSSILAVPGGLLLALAAEWTWRRIQPRLGERWDWPAPSPARNGGGEAAPA
jgi:membrane-associated phospholipid phosphatase